MDQNEDDDEDTNLYGTIKREVVQNPVPISQTQENDDHAEQQIDSKEIIPLELIIKGKKEKLTDEEIQKLIDENYHLFEEVGASGGAAPNKDSSVIYYEGKVYD